MKAQNYFEEKNKEYEKDLDFHYVTTISMSCGGGREYE